MKARKVNLEIDKFAFYRLEHSKLTLSKLPEFPILMDSYFLQVQF